MEIKISLEPVNETNREAVLALTVREDQPFVAPNDVSLREADEANAKQPGVARPFAIYADEKLVGRQAGDGRRVRPRKKRAVNFRPAGITLNRIHAPQKRACILRY